MTPPDQVITVFKHSPLILYRFYSFLESSTVMCLRSAFFRGRDSGSGFLNSAFSNPEFML
jgi:hypothetical protein